MKKITFLLAIVGVTLGVSSANALTCFSNPYGSGCTSRLLGTVAVTRDGAVAVGRNGDVTAYRRGDGFYSYNGGACYWRNGRQICGRR